MSYPDYRALCADLLDALLSESGPAMGQWSDLIARARAALAQPEAIEPTEEELLRTFGTARNEHCYDGPIDDWPRRAERAATIHALRVVLARWGRPAAGGTTDLPPVQETAPERIWLHLNGANEWLPFKDEDGVVWSPDQIDESDIPYVRADLAQPAAAPVPVSEQPWQRDEWCDQAGRCWFHSEGREFGDWYLLPAASMTNAETHCLPWWAIPLP